MGHVCLFLWPIKSIFVNHIRLTAVSGFTSRSSGNLSVDMSLPWKLLNNMIGDRKGYDILCGDYGASGKSGFHGLIS